MVKFKKSMPHKCLICLSYGTSGLFSFPGDKNPNQALWREICDLEPGIQLKPSFRVCFRHFPLKNFNFNGSYLKLKGGKS